MLSISGAEVVLWLHVLAACVWIGGQVTVAALIPLLRGDRSLTASAGRRYAAVAWPAFLVLVVTGVINASNAGIRWSSLFASPQGRTLAVKLGFVAVSGLAAAAHSLIQAPRTRSSRPVASAVLGSLSVVAAIAAALYGVVIAGG